MEFVEAVDNTPVETTTWNGMKAYKSTLNANVDLFFQAGASRGKDITPLFEKAYLEDRDTALRILQWLRDIRGGAGERQLFRQCLKFLEKNYKFELLDTRILENIANIGRFDDLLIFDDHLVRGKAFGIIENALASGNGLCAKWLPRKGPIAASLAVFLGLSPKQYRKKIVGLTKVVETKMCQNEWDSINFEQVPSLAMARYTKAFGRHTPKFAEYKESLAKGEAKVNAGAIYPYDVLKTIRYGDDGIADEQWKALPDYMGDNQVLPLVDVSGSMAVRIPGTQLYAMDVAISLGLYCSDKNKGTFKDLFLTFSADPEFVRVKGSLSAKVRQMQTSDWGYSTNLEKAIRKILNVAIQNSVEPDKMPQALLIMSDMQFDVACRDNDSALDMMRREYEQAGYKLPGIIFWNLNSAPGNTPVTFRESGVATVSGFSPSILKSVLAADFESMTPESIMRQTIDIPRYDIFVKENRL